MKEKEVRELHDVCKLLSNLKSQIITTNLPHFGNDALFFQNDEITTGLINNTTEIKIHLLTGQLIYSCNEDNFSVNLRDKDYADIIAQEILKLVTKYGLVLPPSIDVARISEQQLLSFHTFALKAKKSLELFRMMIESGNYTLVHLWPEGFDFSMEWFTGKNDEEQIGIGISPGEEQYETPYLYVNPYPFNKQVIETKLPIGIWHTKEWNGIKVEWDRDLENYSEYKIAQIIYELYLIAKNNFRL
ncbi:MAG TPA: hypothetical protein VH500_00880 [Nitrososphaeraceae archaeon]|jgi:hypothetical protein